MEVGVPGTNVAELLEPVVSSVLLAPAMVLELVIGVVPVVGIRGKPEELDVANVTEMRVWEPVTVDSP